MTSVSEIILSPGDLLYREGDANDSAYVIEDGEVILYTELTGKRVDVERRGAGSIVGELSILTNQPRAVTVEAVRPCRLYRISAELIISRFENLDPILRACVETSICFTATFTKMATETISEVSIVPSTLRNSAELIEQFRLETDLVRGFDKEEFSLVYQPIVQLSDGKIVGFEALTRWHHMILGDVPPERFIEVAETMGSVKLITEFAIMEACAALKRMRALDASPEGLYASVNISGKDIGRQDFTDFLAFALNFNDLEPNHIKLEVTETALIPNIETADKNLKRIRALGCGISIDDFGTGYSNLAYLKSLPLTALKIDRAFAGDVHANAVSRGIVKMLLTLGKDLDVDVIAEGLETRGDVETLRDLGCQFAQGHYFSKPICEADFITLIAKNSIRQDVA